MGRRDDDSILFRQDKDVLAVGTVGPEGIVAAAPHLVTVALEPVTAVGVHAQGAHLLEVQARRGGRDLVRGHLFHPVGGNDLLAVESATAQDAKPHPGQVLQLQIQSPAAGVDAGRAFQPLGMVDAERLPQAGVQIIDNLLSRHLLNGGRKDIGPQAVVTVAVTGFVLERPLHEAPDPVTVSTADGTGRIRPVAGIHRQKMPDRDALQGIRGVLRDAFRKQVHDFVIQVEQSLGDGKTHGGSGEGL